MTEFEKAKQAYAAYGVDVEAALMKAVETPISLQCWQLDDVSGFENAGDLTGGIQATGNYPGKARNYEELTQDLEKALSLIPGKKKVNLHAIYQSDNVGDRKDITVENFARWIDFAKKHDLGLDFNPTMFSSSHMFDGCSLSSDDEATRQYWIEHCINSIKVSEAFAKATGQRCLCNIWIPDGMKEDPADRLGPRQRLKDSLDQILAAPYDKNLVDVAVESKVFGIGLESYTVGSNEFYISYAVAHQIPALLDMGHYHPTENVADKISSLLCFLPRIALHLSRPVRWDSDHVIRFNDDLKAVFDELVRNDALDRTDIGLDFFDASINRVAALVIGARNAEKALLNALLTPWDLLKKAQNEHDHTRLLELSEDIKTLPFGEVFAEYCARNNVPVDGKWYGQVEEYEKNVLLKR
ncbi:MAG: L-rhamnose isomerase [Candidatus Enteromonas sp.]|nr:L-rhamnose isomerase [Candidatus Enteromonas sp.]